MNVEEAKQVLEDNGYYVGNLWHIEDVKVYGDVSDDDAYNILDSALTNEWIMEQINVTISDLYDLNKDASKRN